MNPVYYLTTHFDSSSILFSGAPAKNKSSEPFLYESDVVAFATIENGRFHTDDPNEKEKIGYHARTGEDFGIPYRDSGYRAKFSIIDPSKPASIHFACSPNFTDFIDFKNQIVIDGNNEPGSQFEATFKGKRRTLTIESKSLPPNLDLSTHLKDTNLKRASDCTIL